MPLKSQIYLVTSVCQDGSRGPIRKVVKIYMEIPGGSVVRTAKGPSSVAGQGIPTLTFVKLNVFLKMKGSS